MENHVFTAGSVANSRRPDSTISAESVVDLLVGLEFIEPRLGSKAVDWLLNEPEVIDMDDVLLPTALELRKSGGYRESVPVIRLSGAVSDHLRRRITEPLMPARGLESPSAALLSLFPV